MDKIISQRLESLREWLVNNDCDAVIIPHEDEFLGEYVPEHNERLLWATGFTGSAGAAVITKNNAAIFVDGRYTVQVQNQAPHTLFEYCHLIEQPYLEWINSQSEDLNKVAYDPSMHTGAWLKRATQTLDNKITLVAVDANPVDSCWHDRPIPNLSSMSLMPLDLSGQSSQDKRINVASILKEKQCDAAILTQLDSICWLLNIRGLDVPRLPVLLSHAIIYSDSSVKLFLDPSRVHENFAEHAGTGVTVESPSDLSILISKLSGKRVLFDPQASNAWFKLNMEKTTVTIIEGNDPCAMLKATKNNVEVKGMKDCHVKDGVAMVKFLRWLDEEVELGHFHNEAILSDRLQSFREEAPELVDLSFDTISAAGKNAAMCHYNHNDQTQPGALTNDSLYLVDSGGQYPNGTTDITRTIAIGQPSLEMRKLFTLVLKGHIGLSNALFPAGTTGIQLDSLARQHLWMNGFDYDHGTGHGVGHFLSVHEGPQNISKRPNPTPLVSGMVVSNEPGYYRTDAFGIRIENLVLVKNIPSKGDFNLLGFESLTLCPIDYRNIETDLLTDVEIKWLNDYHTTVRETLSPLLSVPNQQWLSNATAPLPRS